MIFYINLVVTVVLFLYFAERTISTGAFLSPHLVLWSMPIALLFYPALIGEPSYLRDDGFNLLISAGVAGSAFACFLFPVPKTTLRHDDDPDQAVATTLEIPAYIITGGALIYGSYLTARMLWLIVHYGGVLAALSVGRVTEYLSGGILKGGGLELVLLLPAVLYYCCITRAFARRHYFKGLLLTFLLWSFGVFTETMRWPMIMPLVALALVLLTNIPEHRKRKLFPIVMGLGVGIALLLIIMGAYLRYGYLQGYQNLFSNVGSAIQEEQKADFRYYEFLNDLYRGVQDNTVRHDYGAAWYFAGPISLFPRQLWPSKPITSTANRLTEAVYSISIGEGDPITTFTIYGEGYWQFGYIGAFLAPGLFLAIFVLLFSVLRRFRYTEFWVAVLLAQMVTFWRDELPIPQLLLNLLFLSMLYLTRRKESPLELSLRPC